MMDVLAGCEHPSNFDSREHTDYSLNTLTQALRYARDYTTSHFKDGH
jgi:hypothetical protein